LKITRQKFLDYILGIIGFVLAGLLVISMIIYIIPPEALDSNVSKVVAAKVGELQPNSAKIFRFGNKPAIIIKTLQGALKAFSAVCTHLNCTVQYSSKTSLIWCPCHNGKFDLNGKVVSGPPPKPLEEYKVNVSGDDIIVSKP
jgi:cytochrome b6-f complex iron-sulfur subunit